MADKQDTQIATANEPQLGREEQLEQALVLDLDSVLEAIEAARREAEAQQESLEVRSALAEIAVQISQLQAKLASTESTDIESAIANLQDIAAQLESGTFSSSGLAAAITNIGNAISEAHTAATIATSEWKAEVVQAAYEEYQQAKLELARDLMAQTEYYARNDALFSQTMPGYANWSEDFRKDVQNITRVAERDNPELRRNDVASQMAAEMGLLEDYIKLREERKQSVRDDIFKNPDIPQERKDALRELWAASNIGNWNVYMTPRIHELIQKGASGELSIEQIREEAQKELTATKGLVSATIGSFSITNPEAAEQLRREAEKAGMTLEAYVYEHMLTPEQITGDPNSPLELISAASHMSFQKREVMLYMEELGLGEMIDLRMQEELSPEEQAKLEKLDRLLAMGPEEAAQFMVEHTGLHAAQKDVAVEMFRVAEAIASVAQTPDQAANIKTMLIQSMDQFTPKNGDSPAVHNARMAAFAAEMEDHFGLAKGSMGIIANPELREQIREMARTAESTEAFNAQVAQLMPEYIKDYEEEERYARVQKGAVVLDGQALSAQLLGYSGDLSSYGFTYNPETGNYETENQSIAPQVAEAVQALQQGRAQAQQSPANPALFSGAQSAPVVSVSTPLIAPSVGGVAPLSPANSNEPNMSPRSGSGVPDMSNLDAVLKQAGINVAGVGEAEHTSLAEQQEGAPKATPAAAPDPATQKVAGK